jgi:hypothetical protein
MPTAEDLRGLGAWAHMTTMTRITRLFGDSAEVVVLKQSNWLLKNIDERSTTPALSDDPNGDRQFDLLDQVGILILYHFDRAEGFPTAESAARRAVQLGQELFFGSWRNHFAFFDGPPWNDEKCRQELGWYDTYRESLCAALLLGDLAAVSRLSHYPDSDAYQSEDEATPAQHEFYVLLASILRGDSPENRHQAWERIKSTRSSRLKPLVGALEAIENRDAAAAVKAIQKYCAYYRSHRDDIREFYAVISLDASILWNLASLRGLAVNGLTLDEQDVILTPASCGLISDKPVKT